ncbi:MAG: hypothetical protein JSW06_02770 [Thermoplasmatales archaeon]|nr:MAG: hypothetical protein JSW06_02770 [Thermoplasmatales archaeon]
MFENIELRDLDILIPEIKNIEIDDGTGKLIKLRLFVPAAVGTILLQEIETLKDIFKGEIDEKAEKLMFQIFEVMFKRQHKFMTAKWCEENIQLPTCIIILSQMMKPIVEYLKMTGIADVMTQAETPEKEKNPQEKNDIQTG